jgi:hypothetical protein
VKRSLLTAPACTGVLTLATSGAAATARTEAAVPTVGSGEPGQSEAGAAASPDLRAASTMQSASLSSMPTLATTAA